MNQLYKETRRPDFGQALQQRGLFLLCVAVALLLGATQIGPIAPFRATHWLFNYDYGYIKRALPGTLYQLFETPVSMPKLFFTQLLFVLAATLLFAGIIAASLRHHWQASAFGRDSESVAFRNSFMSLLIAVWLLSGSGTVMQAWYDLGRFDVFGWLFLSVALITVMKARKYQAMSVVMMLSLLSVVVHEALFLWVPGVVFGLWLARHRASCWDWFWLLAYGVILTALVFITGGASYSDYLTFEQARAELSAHAGFLVDDGSLMVHYRNLRDNLSFAASLAFGPRNLTGLILAVALLLPYCGLLLTLARTAHHNLPGGRVGLLILLLATLMPLPLFVLAADQGRWLSMLNLNFAYAIIGLLLMSPGGFERLRNGWALVFFFGTIAQIGLGPFGVMEPLPDTLIPYIISRFFMQIG